MRCRSELLNLSRRDICLMSWAPAAKSQVEKVGIENMLPFVVICEIPLPCLLSCVASNPLASRVAEIWSRFCDLQLRIEQFC